MDRKLIVTLLKKHIQELEMITEGFMEMTEYPKSIIALARKKTEDILEYISELESIKITLPELGEKDSRISDFEDDIAINSDEIDNSLTIETSVVEITEEVKIVEEEKLLSNDAPEIENEDADDFDGSEDESVDFLNEEPEKREEGIISVDENVLEEPEQTTQEVQVERTITTEVTTTIKEEKKAFHIDTDNSTIADSHNNKKIDDIRQAISIGDRFRFQRELFNGNGEILNKTLSYLNQLNDFEEAHTYLKNKFKWNEEDETLESFYQIIKRRYL